MYKGIITAMVTPILEDESIDLEATDQLIEQLIKKGVNGLFILGTNGEAHMLSREVKLTFIEHVVKTVSGRVPVIAGVGGNGTKEVIDFANTAEALGIDALSIITPYFIPPTQEELIWHYVKIAQSVQKPILLYNMPAKTGINIEPKTLHSLMQVERIVGIKDSSGNIENLKGYIRVAKEVEGFSVLCGSDSSIFMALGMGADGAITALSNVLTAEIVAIFRDWTMGYFEAANKRQEAIEPLRTLNKIGTLPSVLKYAVAETGIPVGGPCKPVQEPREEIKKAISQLIKEYKEIGVLR
ncbi:4-hydroxy-tetrahydrodipicolinate synthase [Marinilactibacillus kalidii]|uniref:4-hydroxy-tetrahydrodipicolinate synthase n=1 Tax=Marinilactibacillus kalidii TaxID=2820274 RepID=UPI001ABDD5A8|nr:4-hydroxy-tetrahydrodipicolinate synthase [Marinilactibacillus kalidii]